MGFFSSNTTRRIEPNGLGLLVKNPLNDVTVFHVNTRTSLVELIYITRFCWTASTWWRLYFPEREPKKTGGINLTQNLIWVRWLVHFLDLFQVAISLCIWIGLYYPTQTWKVCVWVGFFNSAGVSKKGRQQPSPRDGLKKDRNVTVSSNPLLFHSSVFKFSWLSGWFCVSRWRIVVSMVPSSTILHVSFGKQLEPKAAK